MSYARICWLQPARDHGKEEIVSKSRIKPSMCSVGDEVKVAYKSQKYRARIVELDVKKDTGVKRSEVEDGFSSDDDDVPLKKMCCSKPKADTVSPSTPQSLPVKPSPKLTPLPVVDTTPRSSPPTFEDVQQAHPLPPPEQVEQPALAMPPAIPSVQMAPTPSLVSSRSPRSPHSTAHVTEQHTTPTLAMPPAIPSAQLAPTPSLVSSPQLPTPPVPVEESTPRSPHSTASVTEQHSTPRSPTPPPPFNATIPQTTSQPTPSTVPSLDSLFPRSLDFAGTPDSFLGLLNSEDTDMKQILRNQQTLITSVAELTNNMKNMEQTLCRLTQVLTKVHAKPVKIAAKALSPDYVDNMDGTVQVGDENSMITLNKRDVDRSFHDSATGKDFVLKLLSLAFTSEELAASNYPGGRTICGLEVKFKRALKDEYKFKAIVGSAEKNFVGCTTGKEFKILKDAVNNKCRKLDSRLKLISC